MAGPSTHSVKDSKRPPPHVTVLDNTVINEVARQLLDEFLPDVEQIEVGVEMLEPFLEGYSRSRYGEIAAAATFAQTVSIPNTPITIHRGGGLKAWAALENGQVTMPHPLLLDGFTAFGPIEIGGWTLFHGLVGIDRLFAADGHVHAALCCIPFLQPNVTTEILNNPMAQRLFPQGEIKPVSLSHLIHVLKNPPPGGTGPDIKKLLLDALHEVAVQIKFYHNRSEALSAAQPALTSLRVFINVPELLHTIETGAFRRFDFTGILDDSEAVAQQFPLYLVPRPKNFYFSADSTANLTLSYEPDSKTTDIAFDNIDAKVYLMDWFILHPMELSGSLRATIEAGSRTRMHFDQVTIRFPMFPAESTGKNFISVEATLNGDVFLHMEESGQLQLDRLTVHLSEIKIRTPDGQSIGLGTAANTVEGRLAGTFSASYDVRNDMKLQFAWETTGEANLQSGRDNYHFDDMTFAGNLVAQLIQGRLQPQLEQSSLRLAAEEIANTNGSLGIQKPWLSLIGGEKIARDTETVRTGVLRAGGDNLAVAGLALSPSLHMELRHTNRPTGDELVGFGTASLQSEEIPVIIKSRIHGKADDGGYAWGLDFDEPVIAGPLVAAGSLSIGRQGTWAEARSVQSFSKFSIQTQEPYSVSRGGETMASDITIQGAGDDSFIRVVIDAGALPAATHGHFVLAKRAESDRVSGDYMIERDILPLPAGTELRDLKVNGHFVSVPIQQFSHQPGLHISKGELTTQVAGDINGPMAIAYEGQLSYDAPSGRVRFSFDDDNASHILIGPIQDNAGMVSLDGRAVLRGSASARIDGKTPQLSGRRLGVHEGQLFIELSPELSLSPLARPARRIPLLDNFLLSADIFHTDLTSVQLGGDGLRLSTDVYFDAIGLQWGKGARKRHVEILGIERLPLSDASYWPLLKEVAQTVQKAGAGVSR